MESLWKASGIPVGIVDPDGKVLVATGWQRICFDFHRRNPQTAALCRESDRFLQEHLKAEQPLPDSGYVEYRCKNGMIDIGMPIIIGGEYLATLFLGQFFHEPPDEDFFREQALRNGFDVDDYLAALKDVPIYPREKVEAILEYHRRFVDVIARMGLEKLESLRVQDALARNKERYKTLVETLPHGVQECDVLGTITYANPAYHLMNGYPPGALVGTPIWSRLTTEEEKNDLREYLAYLVREQPVPEPYTSRNLTSDGRLIDIQVDWNYRRDLSGNVIGFLAIITDITERNKSEESLRESETKFRTFFEESAAPMSIISLDGRFMDVNPEACRYFGYSREELCRMEVLDVTSYDDLERTRKVYAELLKKGKRSIHYEKGYRTKDGRFVWGETTVASVCNVRNEPQYFVALTQDITERKSVEKALESLARFPQENTSPVLRLAKDGTILFYNAAAVRILPLFQSAGEFPITDEWMMLIRKCLEEGQPATVEKDWEKKIYSFDCIPVSSEGYVNLYGRDVTREREVDRFKDEFISMAAHELQTPLTSVLGYTELLLQEEAGLKEGERREFLGVIREKALVLKRLVRDLLDLSQIRLGRQLSLMKRSRDIGKFLREFIAQNGRVTERCRLVLDLPERCPVFPFDRFRIEQVLVNLIGNAEKFSSRGGTITVRGEEVGSRFRISIIDEGIGMTPEEVSRMFDKFYRADTSNTAREGLGLGMSIVKSIIEAHVGEISVESRKGVGTTVAFELPLKNDEASS